MVTLLAVARSAASLTFFVFTLAKLTSPPAMGETNLSWSFLKPTPNPRSWWHNAFPIAFATKPKSLRFPSAPASPCGHNSASLSFGGPVQIQSNKIVRGCVLVILILSSMDTSLGQEKPEAQIAKQPAIKVQTTLVMVPAIVTDRSGSHVEDLKEEDFQLSRNGKTQQIGFFRHLLTKPELMKSAAAPAEGGFTNAVESNNQRLTIFVVDFLNSSFEEQRTARQQLLKFLSKSLDVREPLSLLALDQAGVRVIHDFTTDPAVLAEALKKVTEQPSSKDRPESNPIEETYRMVQGLAHQVGITKCSGAAEPLEYAGNRDKFSGHGHGRSRSRNAGSTA